MAILVAANGSGLAAEPNSHALAVIDQTARSICQGARSRDGRLRAAKVRERLSALRDRLTALDASTVLTDQAIGALAVGLAHPPPLPRCLPDVTARLRGSLVQRPPARVEPPPAPSPEQTAPGPVGMEPPPAPPPAPPSIAAPQASAPARSPVDVALDKLATGHAAFTTPDHATLGDALPVQARLSAIESESQLAAELAGAGTPQSAALKISDQMSATLDGNGGFDVSPAGPQSQFVSGRDTTVWNWTVTPMQSGHQTLTLTFDVALTIDGEHGTRHIATLQRTIDVSVSAKGWLDRIKAFFDEVSWLWSVPVLALGGVVATWWNKKRRS